METVPKLDPETTHLLHIFPDELWNKILADVNEVSDYKKISNASPYLRTLLLPQACQLLSPQVMPLVFEHNPQLILKEKWSELLACRLVSRCWKENADKSFLRRNEDYCIFLPHANREDRIFYFFHQVSDFRKFEDHFDATHQAGNINPFPSRGVGIHIDDDLDPNILLPFYEALTQFLEKYGAHIWYLNFFQNGFAIDVVGFWSKIRQLLDLTPNLRGFWFVTEQPLELPQAARNFMDEDLENYPFPRLPHLHFIDILVMPTFILANFVRQNPQIKAALVPGLENTETFRFYLEQMPNLTALEILLCSRENFQALAGANLVCTLKKLTLNMQNLNDVPCEEVFGVLESHFSQSVEQLHLQMPARLSRELTKGLSMAKLKHLKLSMLTAVPLDFLMPLGPTLEHLELNAELPCRLRMEESIMDIYKCWCSPEKSNMWSLFPKLKSLTTNGKKYLSAFNMQGNFLLPV